MHQGQPQQAVIILVYKLHDQLRKWFCHAVAPLAFHPSPSGAPSSPLPFSQHPLPTEELGERDIPFPLLRYEEELLAGLLQLQHQHGPVESVDQLLMLQPGCAMPEGISAYFPGEP